MPPTNKGLAVPVKRTRAQSAAAQKRADAQALAVAGLHLKGQWPAWPQAWVSPR